MSFAAIFWSNHRECIDQLPKKSLVQGLKIVCQILHHLNRHIWGQRFVTGQV
ncbi:hypothetical protein SFOMI_2679 [Sphingobium fuliginis]|uniref:Uncharacterized protein n=1 Tax=Sphingobium fuliginis (strain ATCC 27551) TaxID=336203 RepID=A0A292ZGW2_SPHSA|nr:hypothetical protein SFOMI_2679 [Sphingobium fuliginis]